MSHDNLGSEVESGTAEDSLVRAVEAASSAAPEPTGDVGDTSEVSGESDSGTTPAATAQTAQKPADSQSATDGIPESRIQAAVRNAREKTRREIESQYASFRGLDPQKAQLGQQLLEELQSNPEQFLANLQKYVQPTAAQPEYPEGDLVSKDGQLRTYRAETIQKVLDTHGERVQQRLLKQLEPVLSYVTQAQQRETEYGAMRQREQEVSSALEAARQLPHFTKENEPKILEKMMGIPDEDRAKMGPIATLHLAYSLFLKDEVFPTLQSNSEQAVRKAYTKKAAASAGVHPASQAGDAAPKKPRTEEELAAHMEALYQSAG